jgi:RHS repeat-associated protein
MSYDLSGNVKTLGRKGKIGTNLYGDIDQLSYDYESNSNKIKKVSDLQGLNNHNVGDFRDSSNIITEYEYWQDGSLKIDRNKKISQVDYNYLKLPKQITFEGGQWIRNQYDASGKKLKSSTSDGIIYDFVGNIMYKNDALYQITYEEGRIVNGNYEYDYKDHLGNLRVSFRDSLGVAKIVTKLDYDPWGLTLKGLDYSNPIFNKNNFQFGSKEKIETFGLNWIDFGARQYMPDVPHFTTIDPMAEKTMGISPFVYALNNPLNMIDIDGKYAVSVHYQITYDVLRSLGYSKERADLIAHYSSTYADHPPEGARFGDFMLHPLEFNPHPYRPKIDYTKTAESQDEKNSQWHSMMSDAESNAGMTRERAMKRGLRFGWDNIFASKGGKDLGKLGQGLHALQDAIAHGGMKTNDHLGANWSSVSQTLGTDMYGSTTEASRLTWSATIVTELLQGKTVNLKDGDNLTVTGMSGKQLKQVMTLLVKQGFQGTLKNN